METTPKTNWTMLACIALIAAAIAFRGGIEYESRRLAGEPQQAAAAPGDTAESGLGWETTPTDPWERRQNVTDEHIEFSCMLSDAAGGTADILFNVERSGPFDARALPWGLKGVMEHGAITGSNAESPVLIARSGMMGSGGLVFIEAPGAGATILTIHPHHPPAEAAVTGMSFTADYTRHMSGVVSHYQGQCRVVGAL